MTRKQKKKKNDIEMKDVEKLLARIRTVVYFFPVVAWAGFSVYLLSGLAEQFTMDSFMWMAGASFLISGVAMYKKKVWGFIPGFFIGVALISTAMQEVAPPINLWPGGLALCLYFGICSLLILQSR